LRSAISEISTPISLSISIDIVENIVADQCAIEKTTRIDRPEITENLLSKMVNGIERDLMIRTKTLFITPAEESLELPSTIQEEETHQDQPM
jgi:hypothetical protein